MGAALQFATQLGLVTCASCGIQFGMPADYEQKRKEDGRRFYCPNGHDLVFGSEIEKLKKELAREKERREQAEREALTARQSAGRARAETKRIRTRVAAGMCPCCKRSFVQLRRHMATKHPDFRAVDVGPQA